ncbi:unnamed protein product [Ectocarpus sp. CCAP 1310/34]|nr:unnamed protein product [Ectocarpus sp. CCAP 1310/34]
MRGRMSKGSCLSAARDRLRGNLVAVARDANVGAGVVRLSVNGESARSPSSEVG